MLDKYAALIQNYSIPDEPPARPPKPTVLSAEWFKSMKPKPFLPPRLQLRFPLNLLIYSLLPILIPTFITLALTRFTLATRSSKSRIRLLEKEANTSGQQKLIHILADLEKEMEDAVVDLIDNADSGPVDEASRAHPIISPNHRKIATWLNTLPIKKELAYFESVRNSHAIIVSRDVKRFEMHKLGEPVIRHWADSFII